MANHALNVPPTFTILSQAPSKAPLFSFFPTMLVFLRGLTQTFSSINTESSHALTVSVTIAIQIPPKSLSLSQILLPSFKPSDLYLDVQLVPQTQYI